MKTSNIRFLDSDKWQGLYENGELTLECRSQDVGEILMTILAERDCPNRTFKRVYIPGNKRCPEKWTEELEEKAK